MVRSDQFATFSKVGVEFEINVTSFEWKARSLYINRRFHKHDIPTSMTRPRGPSLLSCQKEKLIFCSFEKHFSNQNKRKPTFDTKLSIFLSENVTFFCRCCHSIDRLQLTLIVIDITIYFARYTLDQ